MPCVSGAFRTGSEQTEWRFSERVEDEVFVLKVGAQLHKEARPPKSTGFGCGHLRTTNMTRVESSAGRPDVTPHCRAACAQKAQVQQGDNMQSRRQNRIAGRAWDRKDVCPGLTAYFALVGP